MESVRIKRLRSLSDTGEVRLSPITILLGRNSSGKSTFLRTFPLLKQSIEARITGPLLWYGRFVDFGSFEEAHQYDSADGIEFEFCFEISSDNFKVAFNQSRVNAPLSNLKIKLKVQLVGDGRKENTRTQKIEIEISDSKSIIEFGSREGKITRFQVNELDILKASRGKEYFSSPSSFQSFLPEIFEKEENKDLDDSKHLLYSTHVSLRRRRFRTLRELIINKIVELNHHKTSPRTISKTYSNLKLGSSKEMLNQLKNDKFSGNTWKNRLADWTLESTQFKAFRDLFIAESMPLVLEVCDEYITQFSRQVSYIGPVRATAERYYRIQNLAVNELDSQGQNLAMFLKSLTDSELRDFKIWMSENFGFEISLQSGMGHLSLRIKTKNSKSEYNVADTGFGFSQILPIITQLWVLSGASSRTNRLLGRSRHYPLTFVIEQPELHLHPHFQGLLADVIARAINHTHRKGIDLRLIIETHSEAIVNRLGYLIEEKEIKSEDVNVVIFEPDQDSNQNIVRTVTFNHEGYLKNWPAGFFSIDL